MEMIQNSIQNSFCLFFVFHFASFPSAGCPTVALRAVSLYALLVGEILQTIQIEFVSFFRQITALLQKNLEKNIQNRQFTQKKSRFFRPKSPFLKQKI